MEDLEESRHIRGRHREEFRLDLSLLRESTPLHVQLQSAQSLSRRRPNKTSTLPLCISPTQGSVLSATRAHTSARGNLTLQKTSQVVNGKFVPLRSWYFLQKDSTLPLRVMLPVVKSESKPTLSTLKSLQRARLRIHPTGHRSQPRTGRKSPDAHGLVGL
jgi:hypothetical protein